MSDFNASIIDEFRANAGVVGGPFEGASLLLLHTTGARSGAERVNPLVYSTDGDNLVIFASKGGAPTHPDWYHNVVAHPETSPPRSAPTPSPCGPGWPSQPSARRCGRGEKDRMPNFADYEAKTARQIPVIVLEPVTS